MNAKKVLAVSGGVDSMVMLDIFRNDDVIVAHFNHGTRPSANDDMNFVLRIADERYNLGERSVTRAANLGEGVSEEAAREARYEFLRAVARMQPVAGEVKLRAWRAGSLPQGIEIKMTEVYTAHHLDDLVESVAINLTRGTGWRGLAVLDAPGVRRPFLEPGILPEELRKLVPFDKKDILRYAAKREVRFRQDPTNTSDKYLRNRLREKLHGGKDGRSTDCTLAEGWGAERKWRTGRQNEQRVKRKIYKLWLRQKQLKQEIDELVAWLLPGEGQPWQRSWFENLDKNVALELLRAGALRAGISATRPQLEDFRQAILNYAPGKCFNLPGDRLVKFTKREFWLDF